MGQGIEFSIAALVITELRTGSAGKVSCPTSLDGRYPGIRMSELMSSSHPAPTALLLSVSRAFQHVPGSESPAQTLHQRIATQTNHLSLFSIRSRVSECRSFAVSAVPHCCTTFIAGNSNFRSDTDLTKDS